MELYNWQELQAELEQDQIIHADGFSPSWLHIPRITAAEFCKVRVHSACASSFIMALVARLHPKSCCMLWEYVSGAFRSHDSFVQVVTGTRAHALPAKSMQQHWSLPEGMVAPRRCC